MVSSEFSKRSQYIIGIEGKGLGYNIVQICTNEFQALQKLCNFLTIFAQLKKNYEVFTFCTHFLLPTSPPLFFTNLLLFCIFQISLNLQSKIEQKYLNKKKKA
ncbi:hypothetical protein BpHYR1_038858 [Brachionus plicatilis]|uniref:Transmembrane protein n=1 Tax=Brachionus plicatilis TaxID=10195 RepID=A0A3M7RQE7_BRAPC|nr:hypothetical protein BpHYR1_038858 [Brachionus plicatilis]